MSLVNGLSSSSINNLKGFGGLASGLDRDQLIEGMTYATQSKINGQNQKKDLEEWRQEAIRKLSSSMNDFSNKYLSFASSSNLIGESIYSKNNIEALGTYKDALSIKGSSEAVSNLSVLGIKTLAQDASMTSINAVSNQKITANQLSDDLGGTYAIDALEGETLSFKVGDKTYQVTLQSGDGYAYGTKDEAVAAINKSLEQVAISGGENLSSVIKFDLSGDKLSITNQTTNKVELTSGSGDVIEQLGFETTQGTPIEITAQSVIGTKEFTTTKDVGVREALSGADFTIQYNGESKKITLDEYEEGSTLEDVRADLQDKLDKSFGKGRVKVTMEDGRIEMQTIKPSEEVDSSSTLSIISGSKGVVGKDSVLGFAKGESNRLNQGVSLEEAGISYAQSIDKDSDMIIRNGDGKEINLKDHDIDWNSSVKEIIDAINGIDELGISVSYQETLDKFVVKSTEQGASGEINLSGNLATALFGDINSNNYKMEDGQDAEILVEFGGQKMELVRGSNEISFDGITISAKEKFGFDDQGNLLAETEAVTFNTTIDTEKTVDTVEEMIKDYNAILESVNKEYATKYNRNYPPLTDAQRKEMSESEIKNWEEKAKEGLLYNDSDIRGLASEMRFLIPVAMQQAFKEIGIEVSSSYSDNGKLIFDKAKFEAALEKDPQKVKELMTNESTAENEKGFMVQVEDTFKKYAGMTGATKGILVERAGSIHAPTTMFNNEIQDSIKDIDSIIKQLQTQLDAETDRYIKQFTTLETLISQMNSQSSTLSSYLGM